MILKVKDVLKSLSRTDPDSEAYRDLTGLYSPLLAEGRFIIYKNPVSIFSTKIYIFFN